MKPTYKKMVRLLNINDGANDYTTLTPFQNWSFTPKIDRVVFNEPATIVFWNDGTKTVVKTSPNDKFDKEKGILWAYYLKHAIGSKTKLQKEIARYCEGDV